MKSRGRTQGPAAARGGRWYAALGVAVTLLFLGLAPAAGAERDPGDDVDTKIVNGQMAKWRDWRFFAALVLPDVANPKRGQFCGGSVIAPRVVLTAAHCMFGVTEADVVVRTGLLAPGHGRRIHSDWIRVYPGFGPWNMRNDLAVIYLSRPAGVRSIALANPSNRGYWSPGTRARVGGFGCDDFSSWAWECLSFPARLRQAATTIRSNNVCGLNPFYDQRSMLCAGVFSAGGAPGPCFGDSGGPLVVRGREGPLLTGIVSFGDAGCGETPAFYTRVGRFSSWLGRFIRARDGYRLVGADGGVFTYGDARYFGGVAGLPLQQPIVDLVGTATGDGYWEVGADGGVFTFGDAEYHGGVAGRSLRRPVAGLASTPSDGGYWLVTAGGGVFAFGDADYLGGAGNLALHGPVAGIASMPTSQGSSPLPVPLPTSAGQGYWIAVADGSVFAFGDAADHGGADTLALRRPVVGIAEHPNGDGYWLVTADGGVFAFGSAEYHGGTAALPLWAPIVDIAPTASGDGYWLVASDGGVFAFGDARYHGSPASLPLTAPITGAAAA